MELFSKGPGRNRLDAAHQETQVQEILADYFRQIEAGLPPDRNELLRRYPEQAVELLAFFDNHDQMEKWVAALRSQQLAAPLLPAGGGPALPCTFGEYDLLEVIGHGGMGVVYKARQKGLDRVVALKMIRADSGVSDEEVRRFRTEAEHTARLDHPRIVPVYEVGTHNAVYYFTMKYIAGGSLSHRLAEFLPDSRRACQSLAAVARAVHHAHQHGILHCDLKPGNVLLDADGQPHVSDFGLARRLHGQGAAAPGAVEGTPSYMAPEQVVGQGPLTTAADVYGLGAILYALLTGRPPFRGATLREVLHRAAEDTPIPPYQLNPCVDRDLEKICLQCLAREPEQRYGSAEALACDLERWLADEPISARPVGWGERLWRWCRRKPARAGLVALALAAVAALIALCGVVIHQRLEAAERQQENSSALTQKNQEIEQNNAALLASERQLKGVLQQLQGALRTVAVRDRDQGLQACDQGEPNKGVLYWARGLNDAVLAGADDLEFSLRMNLSCWRDHLHLLRSVVTLPPKAGLCQRFAPDGKTFFTLKSDTVSAWRADTGERVGIPMRVGQNHIHWLGASPTGKRLAIVGLQGDLQIWDCGTGQRERSWKVQGLLLSGAWSADGSRLLTDRLVVPPSGTSGVEGSKQLTCESQVWDPDTGQPWGPPLERGLGLVRSTLTMDGAIVVAGSLGTGPAKEYVLCSWRLAADQQAWIPAARHVLPSTFTQCEFSADGRLALTSGAGGVVSCWEVSTGRRLSTFSIGHPGTGFRALISCDGRIAVTAGYLNDSKFWQVRVWDLETGKQMGPPLLCGQSPLPHISQSPAPHLSLGPDGKTLAVVQDKTVWFWEVALGKEPGVVLAEGEKPIFMSFSSDGRFALAVYKQQAQLWCLHSQAKIGQPLEQEDPITLATFSPDGKSVLTGSSDPVKRTGVARLWEVPSGKPLTDPLLHPGGIIGTNFVPDSKTLVTRSGSPGPGQQPSLQRWSVPDGQPLGPPLAGTYTMSPDGAWIRRVERQPSGTFLDRLYDARTGALTGEPVEHPASTARAVFSPDGRLLLTIGSMPQSRPPRLLCRETQTGKLVWEANLPAQPPGPPNAPRSGIILFSPDSRLILIVDLGETRLWDATNGQSLGLLPHEGRPEMAVFSPDSKTLLTTARGSARLWDVKTLQPLPVSFRVRGSRPAVFHPDGKLLAVVGEKQCRLWEIATGRPVGPPLPQRDATTFLPGDPRLQVPVPARIGLPAGMFFLAEGKTLVTHGPDGTVRLWQIPPPMPASPEQLALWAAVATGLELDDRGNVRPLDAAAWRECQRRLEQLGGPLP